MNKAFFICVVAALVLFIGRTDSARGYAFEMGSDGGPLSWPAGNITMNLQLSTATVAFPYGGTTTFDGNTAWNPVAQAALADWNQYLSTVQFVSNTTALTPAQGDRVNSVFYSSSAFGQGFGADALAVTLVSYHTTTDKIAETDVVVNTAYEWDSYRGEQQYDYTTSEGRYDLRRVLDHEFGHVLGLDHPDEAGQSVVAIMNSQISNLDHIELDDVKGVWALYGQRTVLEPVIVTASPVNGGTISGGGNFQLGSTQQLVATPAAGYSFVQWEDGTTATNRSITVPVGGATYTATFKPSFDFWTNVAPAGVQNPGSIQFINGTFFVFGSSGISTSTDGLTWTSQSPTTASAYNPAAVAFHAGKYVSVGTAGQAWTSTDALNWTSQPTGFTTSDFHAVTYGNGLFVAVGAYNGSGFVGTPIATSPDGVSWTLRTSDYSSRAYSSVIYANGLFVAVGGYGGLENEENFDTGSLVMTSTDGITWTTNHLFPSISYFINVTYGKGLFFANTTEGDLLSSPDGINWTEGAPFVSNWGVAYGDGYFLGISNQIAVSQDGVAFTTSYSGIYNWYSPIMATFGNGRFVAMDAYSINVSGLVGTAAQQVVPTIDGPTSATISVDLPCGLLVSGENSPSGYNAVGLPPGVSINTQTGAITGTPTSAGTYAVKLFATNDAGSGTATLTLTVGAAPLPQAFSTWALANNVTGGMSDTPRKDGIPNLLKYFYGIDPTVPVTATVRAASLPVVATASSGSMLTLTFPENRILENVGVMVETSTDMVSWSTPNGSSITATGNYNGTGDPVMVAQVPSSGTPAQFIRLVVTPQ